ncbi:hypothetical protein FB45DRAFT_1027877 [Roridomyces roridus]|uniref:MIT domain-containing protein n=1 Tax=Roridomyces roridus TaxID=1738132 RepID=A0AAD7BTZ1_9AGAR|nr:hypothetical protein FB45DRAFT_1027877 [Roridomyces roridus]
MATTIARRRSSAAALGRPAPPPSQPIPSLPIPPLPDSPEIARQPPRNLQDHLDLEDPPPPSILTRAPTSSDDPPDPPRDPPRDRLAPDRSEPRIPSSRRALTRALELAREAVQLDSTNEEPEAAVMAYGRSVALLSEVMERVRRGEDSTDPSSRRRNGRPRSAVAQEEEHDTYADRMNILSIIYNIPPVPYSTTNEYIQMTSQADQQQQSSASTSSPTSSASTPDIPPASAPYTAVYHDEHERDLGHDRDQPTDADVFLFEPPRSAVPATISHPYAATQYEDAPAPVQALQPPRRPRNGSAALAPPPPPPSNPLPPAPVETGPDRLLGAPQPTHRRTSSGSRLSALEEEELSPRHAPEPRRPESPPLPPLPSPTWSSAPASLPKPPPSPRLITPRPRGSSYVSPRSEVPPAIINGTTNQGTISLRRTKNSAPPSSRSSSPAESTTSASSNPVSRSSNGAVQGRSRSVSQPGRRPSLVNGRISPTADQRPPLPVSAGVNGTAGPRKTSIPPKFNPNSHLVVQTDLPLLSSSLGPPIFGQLPTTPTSPLPPAPPSDPTRKPYHMMNLLRITMSSPTGGYVTRRLHVPQEVWSQGGVKLANVSEKVRVVAILCSALEELEAGSSECFGAGNVSSGLALGIGSIGRKEGEAWIARLEEFSGVCDGVVANFGKKLGVGEGFVLKKTTWSDKLTRRFDKLTNGKNLDSPAAYVAGLRKLFMHSQLLDEHAKAITSQPVAPAYAAFPADIRNSADVKLKRASQFFATVVLTFVIRDLSMLLDKYAKKCERWLAE